jgi:hypothetical protein
MKPCPQCSHSNSDDLTACYKCGSPLSETTAVGAAPQDTGAVSGPDACVKCGLPPEEGDYTMKLCRGCRDTLASRPIPGWAVASFVMVFFVLAYAFSQLPGSLKPAKAYDLGCKAEEAGDYRTAAAQFDLAAQAFPDSTKTVARLAICQMKSGDARSAINTVGRIEGREVSKELMAELDAVFQPVRSQEGGRARQ